MLSQWGSYTGNSKYKYIYTRRKYSVIYLFTCAVFYMVTWRAMGLSASVRIIDISVYVRIIAAIVE